MNTRSSMKISQAIQHLMLSLCLSVLVLFGYMTRASAQDGTITKAERGITGTVTFQYTGPTLRAKVQRETDSPLVVRVQRSLTPSQYEARFIGNIAGEFDLRDWLEHTDGSPMDRAQPMLVQIISTLPKDPRSDLFEVDGFQPGFAGGYRLVMILLALVWLAVPLVVIVRRILAKPQIHAVEVVIPPPTLAEKLRPLIAAAAQGELCTSDKARLELLLLHYWRREAQLPGADMAHSIQQLRSHPQAGPMISALEKWLHSAEASSNPESIERVLQLLSPFEAVPAPLSENQLAGSRAL